jgi:DNA-binding PadR family transcriptional regulator
VQRAGDMTPQLMVLGIVAERAGTVSDIQRRLSDLFCSADCAPNSAHGSLPTLAEKGHVRLVQKGEETSGDVYEITKAGIAYLREWVLGAPPRPAAREAVHGKVEFATLDELAELILIIRTEVQACQAASDEAHTRMLAEQRNRIAEREKPAGWPQELDDELSAEHLRDVVLMWDDIAARRRKLAAALADIHKKYKAKAEKGG